MVQGLGSLPLTGETWIEFQPPSFDLAHLWLMQAFGEKNSKCKISVSLPFKYVTNK